MRSTAVTLEAEAKFPIHRAGGAKDDLAWAKRIEYRFDHGDRAIKKFQIDAARKALTNATTNQGEQNASNV
jgi:hypothetical protein